MRPGAGVDVCLDRRDVQWGARDHRCSISRFSLLEHVGQLVREESAPSRRGGRGLPRGDDDRVAERESAGPDGAGQVMRGWTGVDPHPPEVTAEARLRSEEHTSELQSLRHLVCRLLLEKKKKNST